MKSSITLRVLPVLMLLSPTALALQGQSTTGARYTQLAVLNADSAALVLQHFATSSSAEDLVSAVYYASAAVTYFALAPKSSDSTLINVRSGMRRLSGELAVQLVGALRAEGSISQNDAAGLLTWAAILKNMTTRARTRYASGVQN